MEFRKLKPEEIDVKVGNVTAKGYTLLLYKNARVDMAILDETVGEENWQRDHKEVKGNVYCGIGIWSDKKSQWIWKWDCGTESAFGDKEKGEASDSFKRAGFNWGIGRELYTAPFIFIPCTTTKEGNVYKIAEMSEKYRKFKVSAISYNENGIDKLSIVDNKGVVAFDTMGVNKNWQPPKKYVFNSGRYKGLTMAEAVAKNDFNEYYEKLVDTGYWTDEMEEALNEVAKTQNLKNKINEVVL